MPFGASIWRFSAGMGTISVGPSRSSAVASRFPPGAAGPLLAAAERAGAASFGVLSFGAADAFEALDAVFSAFFSSHAGNAVATRRTASRYGVFMARLLRQSAPAVPLQKRVAGGNQAACARDSA